jgi:hypothetical protein
LTFFAKPEKIDPVPGDFEGAPLLDHFIHFRVPGHLKILHAAALFANKVAMGPQVSLKAVESALKGKLLNHAPLRKDMQIPIHRAQTQMGHFLFESRIYPFRRRMNVSALNQLDNLIALSAMTVLHGKSVIIPVVKGFCSIGHR